MPFQDGSEARRDGHPVVVPTWRDRKRYLWLLGLVVPTLVPMSWLGVELTGLGFFWWSGPLLMFIVIPLLDVTMGADTENPPQDALAWLQQDRFYRWATYLYLPIQYLSLLLACWLWSGGGPELSVLDKVGLMITVGGIGGVAINTAHELGHQRAQVERWCSKVALAQTGYGHFYVEHNRGHHARVATPTDPASSRLGESVYTFFFRSSFGGLRSAWALERSRLRRRGQSAWTLRNDVINAWVLTAVLFAALVAAFGVQVLPWLVGQAFVGVCLLESINYLEHYGLRRLRLSDGTYEQVRPTHSWNSNSVVSNVFLFHLQRHSDHHANPQRRFQALCHADEAPQLPAGYSAMVVLALLPPLWRRTMDSRVLGHYRGDVTRAALRPRRTAKLLRRYG